MADVIKRLKYFNGQFLQEADFTAEQDYHLDRQRRHNRQLHTPGIANGLAVSVGTNSVSVAPGTAIDGDGRQIVLHEARPVGFLESQKNQWVLVVISYEQVESDQDPIGDLGKTRFTETPKVEAILETGAPSADIRIRLARLRLDSGGLIAQQDMTVRTTVGSRLRPEETLERLRLSRQGVPENQWPVLSSGAAGRADVAGDLNLTGSLTATNLTLTGNIVVPGMVDGRDISADAATNEAHRNNTNNPHSVTALQAGAITGVGGVLNPGGQVNLVPGNNIAITADNGTNKRITIASATIDGVSNPGGNIDLFPGGAITIAPDNGTAKRITISETHSALTGNPHGTLASQLGEYDFKSAYSDSLYFWEFYADSATLTFNPGFQPRIVYVNGYAQGLLGGNWLGGPINGIARIVNNTTYQHGCGPNISRQSAVPYIISSGVANSGLVAYCHFYNSTVNPVISAGMTVKVSSTTPTSVTFMLNRPATVPLFDIWFHFTCFGY